MLIFHKTFNVSICKLTSILGFLILTRFKYNVKWLCNCLLNLMKSTTSRIANGCRSIISFLSSLPGWARRDFLWGLLIVPVLFVVLVYYLSETNFQGWGEGNVFKPLMEIVHPALLAGFLLVSLLRFWVSRDTAFAFLAVLAGFVLTRELIGQGSTFILITGLIGLIIYGRRHPDRIDDLLQSRWAMSFLGMCFVCYLSSQLLDRGIVKRIGWLILWDTSWKPPFSSNLEESLESLGGFFLLLTPFAVRLRTRPNSPHSENQK